jgi:membrane-bound metal-dependent hydrolase YbcI (DUF457 family)
MDVVHHGLIGVIGYTVLAANGHEAAGLTFIAGSVFPDLDVAFIALGKRTYLKLHQGFTHSFFLVPVFALILAGPLIPILGNGTSLVAGVVCGLVIHTALDLTNTWGIRLFWPLSRKKYNTDILFFIDFIWFFWSLLFFLAAWQWGPNRAFVLYSSVLLIYLIYRFLARSVLIRDLGCDIAVPSAINPLDYFILEEVPEGVLTYKYNVLTRKKSNLEKHFHPEPWIKELSRKSQVYQDLEAVTRRLFITEVNKENGLLTIVAKDLGVRNFRGKFGKTTLTFDEKGTLISEMADI